MFCTAVDACPLAGGEAPEGDEACGGGFVEGAARVVGGEVFVVEGVLGRAADDGGVAFIQFEADGACYGLLGLGDEGVEGGFEGGEPEAFVGEFGVALFGCGLEAEDVSGEGQGLEFAVGGDDGEGCGGFVDLAALYTDEAVFDHVDAAYAVGPDDGVKPGYEIHERQFFPVKAPGQAFLEADLDVLRPVGRVLGRGRQLEDVFGGLVVGVLQGSCFDGAAPEVLVHAVGGLLRGRDEDAVLLGVGHLFGAAHVPVSYRGHDREIRGNRSRRHVEADLVVALSRRAVGNMGGPDLPRGLDQLLGDKRACQGRKERVLPAVERVRPYCGGDVLFGELRPRVVHEGVRSADL